MNILLCTVAKAHLFFKLIYNLSTHIKLIRIKAVFSFEIIWIKIQIAVKNVDICRKKSLKDVSYFIIK